MLGALALSVADQIADATAGAAGRAESAPAALAALLHFLDRPSVDRLRQVLGLTSSGTVRLLDRLAESGYVERQEGGDRRSTAVVLTPAGHAVAEQVCQARAAVLDRALSVLSDVERAELDRLTGKIMVGMMREPGAVRWGCRSATRGSAAARRAAVLSATRPVRGMASPPPLLVPSSCYSTSNLAQHLPVPG